MYKLDVSPTIKTLLVCFLTLSASGCLLTDSFKEDAIEQHKLNIAKDKLADIEKFYTAQELSQKLRDIELMRPDINRVIALENDLAYLTQLMTADNTVGSPGSKIDTELPSLNSIIASDAKAFEVGDNKLADDQSNATDKFSSKGSQGSKNPLGNVPNSTVLLGSIPSFSSDLSLNQDVISTNHTAAMDTKFQGAPVSEQLRRSNSSTNITGKAVSTDKFSSISNGIAPSGCFQPGEKNAGFSVHLASYKTEGSAVSGWKQLLNKHQDLLCELSPKLAGVTVKGQQYLSLRVGPLNDRSTAINLCSAIKAQGDYCASAEFVGKEL